MVVIKQQSRARQVVVPALVLMVLLLPFLFLEKGTVLLFINNRHTPVLDATFKFLSAIGNGFTIGVCAFLVVCLWKVRYFFQFALAFVFQLFFVLFFKQVVFHDKLRPFAYFGRNQEGLLLNLVEGVKVYTVDTFPSGHTATIFFLVTFFALMGAKRVTAWFLMLFALLVGISRVYLVQHFFVDVYFGLFFGIGSSLLAYWIVSNRPISWFNFKVISRLSLARKEEQLLRA